MEDKHTYGKKMARKGQTKVIYKGTFVCIQTLLGENEYLFLSLEQKKLNVVTWLALQ